MEAFLSGIYVLTFDAEAAGNTGVLRSNVETRGRSITLAAWQIADTALACDLTLATNDSDLMRLPGLKWLIGGLSVDRTSNEAFSVA